jgi:hypothetical protein
MATTRLSQSSSLLLAASAFATIFLGFGINAILRPENALTFFEFPYPTSASDAKLIDALMIVYGARDIFMGLAIYATAYFRNRKALGWILIAGSGVAAVDGYVCKVYAGNGEWNHWGYAPMLTVVGSLLLGVLDGK